MNFTAFVLYIQALIELLVSDCYRGKEVDDNFEPVLYLDFRQFPCSIW